MAGSCSGCIIRRRQRSIPKSVFSKSNRLGGLIRCHLLVNRFHVQVLQVYSRKVFDQIPMKKFKPLVVPVEEHNVVLLDLLESFHSLGSNGLHSLLRSLELLIFLHSQLPLRPEVVSQNLSLLLDGVGLIHNSNKIFLQLRIFYLQSLHP